MYISMKFTPAHVISNKAVSVDRPLRFISFPNFAILQKRTDVSLTSINVESDARITRNMR